MIVLGLDPGLATTGYAVVKKESGCAVQALDWGVIETKKKLKLPARLGIIAKDLNTLLARYKPRLAVVESVFFAKNAKTAFSVAEARGVLLLTLAQKKVKVLEITPLQAKSCVAGYGKASKTQVQFMLTKLLGLRKPPCPDDAADALAMAYYGSGRIKI